MVASRPYDPTLSDKALGCGLADGWRKEAIYNTSIQTTVSYPIIGLTGLLNLVTVVAKFRLQERDRLGQAMAAMYTRDGSRIDGPRVVAERSISVSGAAVATATDSLKIGMG
jgi:hypothetical protein